jgi:hypothetical protein
MPALKPAWIAALNAVFCCARENDPGGNWGKLGVNVGDTDK